MSIPPGTPTLVTGASGAIGRAFALALAGRDCRLLLTGRDEARLTATASRARDLGAEADVLALDLAADGAADTLAGHLEERFGGAGLLVHALGAHVSGTVADTPVEALDRQLRVNLRAPYALTRRLLPGLRERQGQIVFVNSSIATRARGSLAAYAASKAALKALADALRDEVNPAGVRVVSVFPGRTASPMQEEVHRAEGVPYEPERLLQPEDVAAAVVGTLELPRTAEVTDLHVRPLRK